MAATRSSDAAETAQNGAITNGATAANGAASTNGAAAGKKTMKAVIWEGKSFHMAVHEVPRAKIVKATDAVVRLTTAAICGTDLHTFHGVWGSPKAPWGMGHEGVGVVTEVGSAVSNIKVGDRVIIPDAIAEGEFEEDRDLEQGIADGELVGFGFGALFGNNAGLQAEYARVPFADDALTVIPNNPHMDLEYVLLSDIFATAWGGLDFSGFQAGDSVAVFGAGPVGLLVAYSALLRGASRVYSVDSVQARLDKAASIGAVPINFTKPGESAAEQILAREGGPTGGVKRAIDACGFECVNAEGKPQENYIIGQCIQVTADFGGIGVIGVYDVVARSSGAPRANTIPRHIEIDMTAVWFKGLSIKGGIVFPEDVVPHIRPLIESGRAKPSFVFSAELDIDEAPAGYERFSKHLETKVAIRFPWEFNQGTKRGREEKPQSKREQTKRRRVYGSTHHRH